VFHGLLFFLFDGREMKEGVFLSIFHFIIVLAMALRPSTEQVFAYFFVAF
jgi:hypothetical protein